MASQLYELWLLAGNPQNHHSASFPAAFTSERKHFLNLKAELQWCYGEENGVLWVTLKHNEHLVSTLLSQIPFAEHSQWCYWKTQHTHWWTCKKRFVVLGRGLLALTSAQVCFIFYTYKMKIKHKMRGRERWLNKCKSEPLSEHPSHMNVNLKTSF